MQLSRRQAIKAGAVGLTAMLSPFGLGRLARAQGSDDRVLVVLFLRGGADGINLCIPRGDQANYVALRDDASTGGNIAIPPGPASLQLDGFFELHPELASLKSLFNAGNLGIVHAVGGTGNYSHFTAMDALEFAAPNAGPIGGGGWLNTSLGILRDTSRLSGPVLTLSGVALGPIKPKSMVGPAIGLNLATPSLSTFTLDGDLADERKDFVAANYAASRHGAVATTGTAMFEAISELEQIANDPPGAPYPSGSDGLNQAFQDAARLIKNPGLGVRTITLDFGGWDHHSNENNQLNSKARQLSAALSGFSADLGSDLDRALVLVMTEFGRTARVNGNGGTDHGWGTLMLALGGGVGGGRVISRADPLAPGSGLVTPSGHWPGLAPGELHVQESSGEERDLKATIDFRDVLGEVLDRFLGLPAAAIQSQVLRGYAPNYPGLFS